MVFLAAQCGALLFWTLQLQRPPGFDRVLATQEFWAHLAVAHASGDPRAGYVFGTLEAPTLLTRLAAAGLSPSTMEQAFTFAPTLLALALAFVGSCVSGSPARRSLTAALAATTAPLWGLAGNLPTAAIDRPAAALIASLTVVSLSAASRIFTLGRRPLWLSAITALGLIAGPTLSGVALSFDWLLLSSAPMAALFLVPAMRVLASGLRTPRFGRTSVEAVIIIFIGAAGSWFWWEPTRTIAGFDEARSGTPALDAPLDWVRKSTPKEATIASPRVYSALIAARTGRRVLAPVDQDRPGADRPFRRARLLDSLLHGEPDGALTSSFGVTHFLLGPGDPDPVVAPEGNEPARAPRLQLRLAYRDENDFRVFELIPR